MKRFSMLRRRVLSRNLRMIMELRYVGRIEDKQYIYYITDPLLFYAIKENYIELTRSAYKKMRTSTINKLTRS